MHQIPCVVCWRPKLASMRDVTVVRLIAMHIALIATPSSRAGR